MQNFLAFRAISLSIFTIHHYVVSPTARKTMYLQGYVVSPHVWLSGGAARVEGQGGQFPTRGGTFSRGGPIPL